MLDNPDYSFVTKAEQLLNSLFEKYYEADDADRWLLRPAISKAADDLLVARLSLFKEGVLTDEDDIVQLEQLQAGIDRAADIQSIAMAALRLAAILGKFA